jgi:hypothetical protein
MVTVFQVTTPENVNGVLYDACQAIGFAGGAIFTIFMLLIGHYVIESIFVVILLSNFNTDVQEYNPESTNYKDRFEQFLASLLMRLKCQRYGQCAIENAKREQQEYNQMKSGTTRQSSSLQMTRQQYLNQHNAISLALAANSQPSNNDPNQTNFPRINSQGNGGITAADIALQLPMPHRSAMKSPDRVRSPLTSNAQQLRSTVSSKQQQNQQPLSPEMPQEEVVEIADDFDMDAALATSPRKDQQQRHNASDDDDDEKTSGDVVDVAIHKGTIARMPTIDLENNNNNLSQRHHRRSHQNSSASSTIHDDDFVFNDSIN